MAQQVPVDSRRAQLVQGCCALSLFSKEKSVQILSILWGPSCQAPTCWTIYPGKFAQRLYYSNRTPLGKREQSIVYLMGFKRMEISVSVRMTACWQLPTNYIHYHSRASGLPSKHTTQYMQRAQQKLTMASAGMK